MVEKILLAEQCYSQPDFILRSEDPGRELPSSYNRLIAIYQGFFSTVTLYPLPDVEIGGMKSRFLNASRRERRIAYAALENATTALYGLMLGTQITRR